MVSLGPSTLYHKQNQSDYRSRLHIPDIQIQSQSGKLNNFGYDSMRMDQDVPYTCKKQFCTQLTATNSYSKYLWLFVLKDYVIDNFDNELIYFEYIPKVALLSPAQVPPEDALKWGGLPSFSRHSISLFLRIQINTFNYRKVLPFH